MVLKLSLSAIKLLGIFEPNDVSEYYYTILCGALLWRNEFYTA